MSENERTESGSDGQLDAVVIRQTPFGGWKGSAVISVFSFVAAIVEISTGNIGAGLAFIMGGCGWGGWAVQEWEHLNGKVINDA